MPLAGHAVWRGDEIKNSKRWIRDLPASASAELDAALVAVKQKGLDWSQITRKDFPLSSLDHLLADIADELEHGTGIMKLRGFPVERYDEDDLRKIYFGLGTHLGTPVFQNRSGELMRAIRDEGAHVGRTYGETKDQKGSTFLSSYARTLTNGGLRFHTDRTDVVGLLCVRQAHAGGVSTLASHACDPQRDPRQAPRPARRAVHRLLAQPLRRGRHDQGDRLSAADLRRARRQVHLALFAHLHRGRPDGARRAQAHRRAEGSHRRPDGDGAGTLLRDDARAGRPAADQQPRDLSRPHAVRGRSRRGHDRLLLRLWLTMANNRPLPEGHEILWRSIDAGQPRGGIQQVTL